MTAIEFKTIRTQLGLTQAQLAAMLGYSNYRSVLLFETGTREVPPLLDRLMRAYAAGYQPA